MNIIFASFDLFNSTAYKYKNKNWFELYKFVIEKITNEVISKTKFVLWKGIGDELVFKKVLSIQSLEKDIILINKIMVEILDELYLSEETRKIYPDIKQLSIKTTMWLIHTSEENKNETDYRIEINGQDDYLGKEMDTGFRISSYAFRSKTILSAAIIYILINISSKILNKIRVIGYSKLKGVWENNEYPICVYFRNKNIQNSFHQPEKNIEVVSKFIDLYLKNKNFGKIKKPEFLEYLDFLGFYEKYKSQFV